MLGGGHNPRRSPRTRRSNHLLLLPLPTWWAKATTEQQAHAGLFGHDPVRHRATATHSSSGCVVGGSCALVMLCKCSHSPQAQPPRITFRLDHKPHSRHPPHPHIPTHAHRLASLKKKKKQQPCRAAAPSSPSSWPPPLCSSPPPWRPGRSSGWGPGPGPSRPSQRWTLAPTPAGGTRQVN